MKPSLGSGVYTFPEAARLTDLKPARVRGWFLGRASGQRMKRVFLGDYEPVDGNYAISFHDLIDLFVAGHLREHGVSVQTVRRVYDRLKSDFNTEHPFCRKELLTDGKNVLMRGLDAQGREELIEVLTRQRIFPQILRPFLHHIDYDEATILAKRWRIFEGVVLDPAICFGKPIIEDVGIPTAVLASAYYANDQNAKLVSHWYHVQPEHVLAAAQFEYHMAA